MLKYLQRIIKNLYARFALGVVLFNYPVSRAYDEMLNTCIDSGILGIEFSENVLRVFVSFNNGAYGKFWNGNKYYAWLMEAELFNDTGKYLLHISNSRPYAYTIYKFNKLINNKLKEGLHVTT